MDAPEPAADDLIPWYKQSSGIPSCSLSDTGSDVGSDIFRSLWALRQIKETLPNATYTPVTWDEAQSVFTRAASTDAAVTDAHFSAVGMLMVTKIEGTGRVCVVLRETKQALPLNPEALMVVLVNSLIFAARMCPPTELLYKGQQDIGILIDPGVKVDYRVSYWKRRGSGVLLSKPDLSIVLNHV
ncbi:hypothetical protein CPB85DRAFT_1441105 [Mucidula mucida]|nr:hypothetical protein CPB85DRAFT_1441105 [Mucidula mucida]